MISGWNVEGHSLIRSWSGPQERSPHRPTWLQESLPHAVEVPAPQLPNFAAHSSFGSGEWIAPWNTRWRVQIQS